MVDYKALLIGYLDENYLHDKYVRYKYHLNLKTNWKCDIAMVRGDSSNNWDVVSCPDTVTEAIKYACENHYNLILRPYSGSWGWKPDFDKAYNEYNILTVTPHGANNDPEAEVPPHKIDSMVFVVSKSDISSDESYFDYLCKSEDSQSYSSAIIAAKLSNLYAEYEDWEKCRNIFLNNHG